MREAPMWKSRLIPAAMTAVLAVALSACATGGDEPTTRSGAGDFDVIGDALKYDPNVAVADGKDTTVKIWIPAAWEDHYKAVAAEYNEYHPNVKFEWTATSFDDHFKKVPLALKSGSGPDLFWMHNSQNAAMLPNMEPLPEETFPREALTQDFRNVAGNVIDGDLYYVDLGLMTGVIYYNTDLWEEAGLTDADIPKTWDEFRAVAKTLTQRDGNNLQVAGFNTNGAEYFWEDLVYQQGKYLFDESGETAVFDSPEALRAAELMYDLYNTDKSGDGTQPRAEEAFANGKAAMIYTWGWASNYFKSSFPDLNYSAFALPVFDEGAPAYGRANGDVSLGVSKNSTAEAKEAALNFVQFTLANNEALIKFDVQDGMAPSKVTLDDSPEIQSEPVLKVETEIVSRVVWPGAVPDAYHVGVQKYIGQSMLVNGTSPKDALKDAEQINRDLSGLGFISVEDKYEFNSEMSYQ